MPHRVGGESANPVLSPGRDCACASHCLVRHIGRQPRPPRAPSLVARAARTARLLPDRASLPLRAACDLPACGAMLPAAASRLWGPRLRLGGAALRLVRYSGGCRAPLPGRRAGSRFGGKGGRAHRRLPRPSLRGVERAARPGRPWVQVPFVPSFPPLRPIAVDGSLARARCFRMLGATLCTRRADVFHSARSLPLRAGLQT